MITVYGIKTCDTVRKALKWLDAQGVEHTYHDFRADGLDAADGGALGRCFGVGIGAQETLHHMDAIERRG